MVKKISTFPNLRNIVFENNRKLEEINDLVKENAMPLASYTWIHNDAVLSSQQKLAIAAWSNSIRDSIKANYPPDSLLRK